ncbi:hypothetical protein EOPP23_07695 [Endozoicomonas sp. OPT23]|uniref:L-cysteine desulfidase family protein n=1 Tax=Endozoicomonas sp. OPT23 TaxID=2072845 RepID=UPI00129AC328|nr:L-serine ammonia-lyase, iron-sulfur-dependent, subunit alpha [Endozoicomonas sp. OPT23]MRI32867.1 hypothetical protein [Endozoicomonas sp. OPT23]
MWHKHWQSYIDLLQQKVVPALGCTEPVSTALAAAHATRLLGKTPERLEVSVSANLLKNGMGVGVPGTGEVGLPIAAAIGAIAGDADAGLQVLATMQPEQVEQAKQMVAQQQVTIDVADTESLLFSQVVAYTGDQKVRVIIKDHHTSVTLIELNDHPVVLPQVRNQEQETQAPEPELTVSDIYSFATAVDLEKIEFINQAAELNRQLSDEGLANEYGLQIGRTMQSNLGKGWLTDDLSVSAIMRSSAASDARMDGAMLPAMSNSGSGNQGIAATMPVVAVADKIKATPEQLTRALILSHLIAIHIKSHLNVLSALCAATTAGTGASAAIAWLLHDKEKGTGFQAVENAIFNMLGDISGIFCDGAKSSCSMKVSTSASAAIKSAMLAVDGIRVTENEGIIERDIEKTIDNLGMIGSQTMQQVDQMIVHIMMNK